MKSCAMLALSLVLAFASLSAAADWPQYRGPARDGVAPPSTPLVDAIAADGLKKLWQSDEIRGGGDAGYGSPVVAAGRVYVYQNYNMPPVHRTLYKGAFDSQGYAADMPEALSKAVEEARTGAERRDLDNRALDPWVRGWLDEHVTAEQRQWRGAAQARLKAGPGALPIDVVRKLAAVVNKRFDNVAALDAWADLNGLDDEQKKKLRALSVPGDEKTPKDTVFCLDAATGKTLWTRELTADWFYYPASSTPAVVNGRLYVTSSDARVFCLDAAAGGVVWQSEPFGPGGYHHNRSSSPILIDGVVISSSEACLVGLDAATGKTLWKKTDIMNQQHSPAAWSSGGRTWALVNAGALYLIDPKDGSAKLMGQCAGVSTPVVSGDVAVVAAGGEIGLAAYRLSPEKGEMLWKVPWKDAHSGALIYNGAVYALGGAFYDAGKGQAVSVDLGSGKVNWQQTVGGAQHSSPILADGRIIAFNGSWLLMLAASPDGYKSLGAANVGAEQWSSPALADGKLYVRTPGGIACYSLAK